MLQISGCKEVQDLFLGGDRGYCVSPRIVQRHEFEVSAARTFTLRDILRATHGVRDLVVEALDTCSRW